MKLLFQSDDFGISRAVTLGILYGIENGLIRNTGLFTNMPSSEFAAQYISQYPECCFGIDINLVAGYPLSNPRDIPSLIHESGRFITSIERFQAGTVSSSTGINTVFEEEPYQLQEVLLEMEAQIERYIDLVGKKPEYLHPHSLITPVTVQAFRHMGEKYDIPVSFDIWDANKIAMVPGDWNVKPVFTIEAQKNTDVTQKVMEVIPSVLHEERAMLICHAGYIDADIMDVSSYSIIRTKDLRMATSQVLKDFVKEQGITLITYRDLKR